MMTWICLQSFIINLILDGQARDFIQTMIFSAIGCGLAGTITYKIRKFQDSPVPNYSHNIPNILCWECWWHWVTMIWNIFNGIAACIFVLVYILRETSWSEEEWARNEMENEEGQFENRIKLGLTVITAVMHIYFGLFVFSYQTSAYYRLKAYNLNVRNQVRSQGHLEANEARRIQPLPNQGTRYGGGQPRQPMGYNAGMQGQPMGYNAGMQGQPMGYNAGMQGQPMGYNAGMQGQPMGYNAGMQGQPMAYGDGIPMQGGPQPGMPMSYNPPLQGNMIYQPPGQPQHYVAPVQGHPIQGRPA
jgi:hypothetical protein